MQVTFCTYNGLPCAKHIQCLGLTVQKTLSMPYIHISRYLGLFIKDYYNITEKCHFVGLPPNLPQTKYILNRMTSVL